MDANHRRRDVGMPTAPGTQRCGAALGVGLAELGDGVDLGELLFSAKHHVPWCRLTELAREGHVRAMIHGLIAKEHHLPFQQRGVDGRDLRR